MPELKPATFYPDSPLLRSVAKEFMELYGEDLGLRDLRVESILFIEDNFTESKTEKVLRGEAKVFEVKELHPAIAERLNADFMVIYYKLNGMKLTPEKLHAYFLEALLRIDPLGGLRKPDVNTFSALASGLGPDWKQKEYIADVRMGELLKGATVQQRLNFDRQTVDNLANRHEATGRRSEKVLPMRPTGTDQGA